MTVHGPAAEEADGRPLHERIAADLRDDIMSGDLAPGDSLPSTAQLKERFGAANATVQKALQLLKGEHLVVGRAGASVTVREHRQRTIRPAAYMAPSPSGEPYRWLTEAANSGRRARSTLLDASEAEPPADVADVADALALQPGGTAILRYQLLSIDGEPAELVASYYPLGIAEGTAITERRRIPGGTPTLLVSLGLPPRIGVDRVSARVATQEQYRLLRLPGDLPVLRTLRVVFSDDDRPIEASVMVKAGHPYEVQYAFGPG